MERLYNSASSNMFKDVRISLSLEVGQSVRRYSQCPQVIYGNLFRAHKEKQEVAVH